MIYVIIEPNSWFGINRQDYWSWIEPLQDYYFNEKLVYYVILLIEKLVYYVILLIEKLVYYVILLIERLYVLCNIISMRS